MATVLVTLPARADIIKIGLRAHSGKEKGIEQWQPTADYLSRRIPEHKFVILPYDNLEALDEAANRGEFSFVLTNPSSYIEMEMNYGAARILTLLNKRQNIPLNRFGSVIFTRKDRGDIQTIDDLKGKRFMAVSERAFGGWRVAWYELKHNHGLNPETDFAALVFGIGIQEEVVFAVRGGQVDAGVVRTDILERMAAAGEIDLNQFRVLGEHATEDFPFKHSTQLYPEWPMAKFGQTPKKLANQVAIELLNISPRDPAAIAGNYVGWTVPLNYQSVHDLLKELRVDSYKDFRQVTIAEAVQQHWVWVLNLTIVLIVTLLTSVIAVRHIRIRRKLDAALLQSEQRLASAQRIAHLGNWDWNVKTGELFWSDEIYRIFGREPQSFKPTYEVFLENIHPDDRQNVVTVVEKALRNETPYVVDHRIVMPDGSVRHVYEQGEVVFDEEGEPLHMIGTIYDITTLRHAEEAVHKLSQAIEQSSATVIITDTEGLIEYVNPRFVETTGYSAEEVIGKNPRILKSGYTSPEEYEELWQTITAGGEWRGEFHNKKKNGELYWESTIISPIKAKNGSIINFLAVKDDITDHKRTEAQLIQSSKLATLGEMATGIAHELNQPLNIIHMAVESLLDEAKDGSIPTDTLTAKLDRIESQTDRASAIINHIRMFGRTDTGELEAVDLEKVARDAVGLVSEQLRLSEIGLMVNQPETCRKVMGQQLQLEQVVLNLLTNARDAIKENEGSGKKLKQITIDITDDPKSEEVGLTVQDTGGGVPDEVLNRIFEPFFTTKEVGKGTGLGLSISYGIISEMKGRIEVANVDGGARFTISLPVAQDTSRQVDP